MTVAISVILPVRNGARYLEAALASILAQSFNAFELIVVNDGSSDATPTLLRAARASDSRVRLLDSAGAGLAAALNLGIEAAQGAYVARMDADDIALPHRFARQAAFLDRHPEIAVLGGQVAHIDAQGALTGETTKFPTDPGEVAAALLSRGCIIKHPTVMARRDALRAAGGYRAGFVPAEDYDLWLRMAESEGLANLPETVLHYRVHAEQISAGINLRQRYAHDLALLAARSRRAGRGDPFAGDVEAGALALGAAAPPPAARQLAGAYAALRHFQDPTSPAPDAAALQDLIMCAHQGLLGDGRRLRTQALLDCARLAARRGQLKLSASAVGNALRISPGRALRGLAEGKR